MLTLAQYSYLPPSIREATVYLKLLKSNLRSYVRKEGLSRLAAISIENNKPKNLDFSSINDFAECGTS